MSTDQLTELFGSAARLQDSQDAWLREIIRIQVEEATRTTSAPEWPVSECLLVGLGEFLVQASTVLSRLADGVVYGQHIDIYTDRRIQEMEEDHDFSELNFLDYMNEKHSSLKCVRNILLPLSSTSNHTHRSIASKLQFTAETVDGMWKGSPNPAYREQRDSSGSGSRPFPNSHNMSSGTAGVASQPGCSLPQGSSNTRVAMSYSAGSGIGQRDEPSSPGSERSPQGTLYDPLDSLSSRGKGNYTCPHGSSCTKGGFRNGETVIFERNSAFRYVRSLFLHESFL